MSALQKISSQMTLIPNQDLRQVEGMSAFFIIPAKRQGRGRRALHGSPAAREAHRRARRDRARDGPPGRLDIRVGAPATSSSGAKKLAEPKEDRLFALTTAAVTLADRARPEDGGRRGDRVQAAVVRRVPQRVRRRRPARRGGRTAVAARQIERKTDEYGFDWIIVRDPDLEDLVASRAHARLRADGEGLRLAAPRRDLPLRGRASIRSTGSTASSAGHSGRSCRSATRNATTRPSSS